MDVFAKYEHKGAALQVGRYEPASPKPEKRRPLRVPGAGKLEIGRLEVGGKGQEPRLTAQISGTNIAYIYTEILLKDQDHERYYGPVAREHVRAARSRQTRGVDRPDWGDPVDLTVDLRPSLRMITDGVDSAFCFAVPERYGASDYRLEGLYATAGGGDPLRAVLTFDGSGKIKRLVAHREQSRRSTPHMLTPKQGDRFTPFVQVLTPAGGGDWEVETALSTPLTLGDQPLRVVTEAPMPGTYLAGVVVEDLDGGLTRKYVPLDI